MLAVDVGTVNIMRVDSLVLKYARLPIRILLLHFLALGGQRFNLDPLVPFHLRWSSHAWVRSRIR